MGAAATPLAFGEIYTALQAGVLDGLEHDPPTILASKFYETAKNYALTQHIFSPLAIYFSDATFQRMDPKLREGFLDAAQEGRDRHPRPRAWGREGSAHDPPGEGRRRGRMRQGSVPQARAAADRQFHQRRAPRPRRWLTRSAPPRPEVKEMTSGAAPAGRHWAIAALLAVSDAVAAILLAADLLVVCVSVVLRYWFNAPVEWSDDVARGLMVGSSFFGAASALARGDNPGVRVLRRPGAGVGAYRDRFRCRTPDDRDRGLCRLQRAQDGRPDGGTDHRLRPAAGTDVLSDGRRRAVHDHLRARHLPRPPAARHDRRDRGHGALSRASISPGTSLRRIQCPRRAR